MHKHKLDEKQSIIFILKSGLRKHGRKTWIYKFSTFKILILVMLNQFLWSGFAMESIMFLHLITLKMLIKYYVCVS